MLQTGFESKCDWLNDLVLNRMKELSIKNYSMHLHSECLHNVWSPIILMVLEVSILFSIEKTYHFLQKFPLSYDRSFVHVTTKQLDAREIDSLSGEPLLVIYMALQQSRHKWWLFWNQSFFVVFPLQRFRNYFS